MKSKWKNGRASNAKIIYRYREVLEEARGLSEKTILKNEASLSLFEEMLKGYDFKVFNRRIALAIKEHLIANLQNKSIRTIKFHLDSIKELSYCFSN